MRLINEDLRKPQLTITKKSKKQALASVLVRRIFVIYLGLAIVLTLIQVYLEYRNTYGTVMAEMETTAHAFEPGIANAIWNFQKPFLSAIVEGMVSGGTITGVEVEDIYKHLNIQMVSKQEQFHALNISITIPLFHTYNNGKRMPIGEMRVYSNHGIVIDRVKLGILLILIASLIKTIGLWFIIKFFANSLLAKPLSRFTEQIKSFDFSKTMPEPRIDIGSALSSELIYLQDTFNDLAKKVLANKQLLVQKEAAESANLAKTSFLAAASHDLRQPMHALTLYLASLERQKISMPVQACLDNMKKCAQAMNDMLNALLDISSIDAGAIQPKFSFFPIATLLERIQTEFEPLANEKGLVLRIARCSLVVHTDDEIIERILRNLLSNAIRYTEKGKILVGCRRHGMHLRIVVYDTGCGIPQDKQQAIFEEFYQVNNHERNRTKGLGLGLAIVQRLSKLIGISISVRSTLNRGSLFFFNLPSIVSETISPITPNRVPNWTPLKNYPSCIKGIVVAIDDEPMILDAMHMLLEQWGYRVITASNGQQALAQLKTNTCIPDAIICDYLLADEEKGTDVITALRTAFNKKIPAFLITGDTLPEDIKKMHASGIPIMHKPFDYSELEKALALLFS